MEKKEIVIDTLKKYKCVSASQLSGWIKKAHDVDMSPSSVSGVLRGLVSRGLVGKSNCGNGKIVYWVIE